MAAYITGVPSTEITCPSHVGCSSAPQLLHSGTQAKGWVSIQNITHLMRDKKDNMANSTCALKLLTRSASSSPVTCHWSQKVIRPSLTAVGREKDNFPLGGVASVCTQQILPQSTSPSPFHYGVSTSIVNGGFPYALIEPGQKMRLKSTLKLCLLLAIILYHVLINAVNRIEVGVWPSQDEN